MKNAKKKALLTLNRMAVEETLPVELSLVVVWPIVIHLRKSLKCSWTNRFIDLEDTKSNLVLIHTLHDSGDPDIRKELRKLLTLDCQIYRLNGC